MILGTLRLLGAALRANLGPALLIWSIGATLVLSYHNSAAFRGAMGALVALRGQMGLLYPVMSTALFGGLLPGLSQAVFARRDWPSTRRSMHWLILFWAYKGLEIELFYRLQARIWGDGTDFPTVAGKVAVDMLVYNPVVAVPLQLLFLRWLARRAGTLHPDVPLLPRAWYRSLGWPLLVMVWAIWLPSVALIYLMPLPLQLPLGNLILWLWMLIMLFTARTYER